MGGSGPAFVGTRGGQEEVQMKGEEHEDPAGASRLHLSRRREWRGGGKSGAKVAVRAVARSGLTG